MKENGSQHRNLRERLPVNKAILIFCVIVLIAAAGASIVLVKASDNPSFCRSCHIMDSYYESWNDSCLLANKHAEEGLVCHDCHEASISIQAKEGWAFISGNYTIPLEKLEVSREFCLECHDDFGSIQNATDFEDSNPHDSHNGEMECSVCHSMHQKSEVYCAQCHIFNWLDELDGSWMIE